MDQSPYSAPPMTSFAQNREDVVLDRVFADVINGHYVEVGAYHPIAKSISFFAYLRGWSGVLVEPQATLASTLRRVRPRDHVAQCAVADAAMVQVDLFEPPQAARATLVPRLAGQYADTRTEQVTQCTLTSLLAPFDWAQAGQIHFMSIDVEGAEKAALDGLDLQRFRPWVLLVESIDPIGRFDTSRDWEPRVIANGYSFAFFDGVTRYYVANEHADLLPRCFPASSVDDFVDDFPANASIETLAQLGDARRLGEQLARIAQVLQAAAPGETAVDALLASGIAKMSDAGAMAVTLDAAVSRAMLAHASRGTKVLSGDDGGH